MSQDPQARQKVIVLILIGVIYSLGVGYLFATLSDHKYRDDFFPRWYASYHLLTADRSIYDSANAVELVDLARWPFVDQLRYYYPAYMLIFTAPLALLPYEVARFIWTIGGLWSVWLGTAIAAQLPKPTLSLNRLTVLLVLVTISLPVLQHTLNGQFNGLGILGLALAYRALSREKYLAAGLWAGGLLFKPQATLFPLIFLLLWSLSKAQRRPFWLGLGLISVIFWGVAELLEPGWVFSFRESLSNYVPVQSVIELMVGDIHYLISLSLAALTLGAILYYRNVSAQSILFNGLLTWTLCLNALIVPMFGMLHMAALGLILALLLNGLNSCYPTYSAWFWWGTIVFLILGLLALVVPLFLVGITGLQIAMTELVFRFTLPALAGLATWAIIFNQYISQKERVHEIIGDYPRL